MTYVVKDVFPTLQGEGFHAGRRAVFVRFAGCNLWSGLDETRTRDAERNGAICPGWCDTDFFRGERVDGHTLACRVAGMAEGRDPLVVFTGGEPLLQLDESLVREVKAAVPGAVCAIETNGTLAAPSCVDWICVSPKKPADDVRQRSGHELKVVFPSYDPREYEGLVHFRHWYVSPEATPELRESPSCIVDDNLRAAARFCMENPTWKLSLQTHKILGLP